MLNYVFKRSICRVREMAYGSFPDTKQRQCDVVYLHSLDHEDLSTGLNVLSERQDTLVHDLTVSRETLEFQIHRNFRNEVRRARKEGALCTVFTGASWRNNPEMLDEFQEIYNGMFEAKGMRNRFNRNMIVSGLEAGQIVITKSYVPHNKNCVVYHAYQYDDTSAMLVYSASTLHLNTEKADSNMTGWMNKCLHWEDLLWFKNAGATRYEWGGINSAVTPNGIAKFKMGFGGKLETYYNYTVPRSLLGQVYVAMIKVRDRKSLAAKKQMQAEEAKQSQEGKE